MNVDHWDRFKDRIEVLPLKIKTALLTALAFACGVAALVAYVSVTLEADYEAQIGKEQKTAALFAARVIDGDIRVRRNALLAVAEHIQELPNYSSKTLQSYLLDKHATTALFNRDVYILWNDGMRVAEKPDRGTLGNSYKNSPYFEELVRTEKPVIQVILGRFAKKPVLVIAVPIFGPGSKLLGALCATEVIEGESFLNFDIQLQQGQVGGIHVLAKDQGIFAASTDPSRVLQKGPPPGVNPLFDSRLTGYMGPGRVVDSKGMDILSAAALAETPNWLVIAYEPTAEAFAPLYAAKKRMYLSAAMVVALLGFLTWVTLRRELQPLEHAARKMAGVHSDASAFEPLPVKGSGEIRLLLHNFNMLRAELVQRNQIIAAERDHLDSLVVARTREMQDLYDQAPCGYHSLDSQGIVVQVNQTELRYLGYSQEEFVGKPIFDFMSARSAHQLRAEMPQFLEQGLLRSLELDFVCKDGTVWPFRLDANLVRDAEGQVLYSRSTLTDDRERQQQKQRMLELNRFLQDVVEKLPFGLLVFDGSHRIVLHNQLLSKLLNLPPDFFEKGDVFHTTLIRFKHARGDFGEQPLDCIVNAYAASLDQRQPLRIERLYANGRSFEVLGQPLLTDHMVVTYTDTSAQKEAEKLTLRAKELAESATMAKSQFLANMSHEIRTPMNGILGLAYVLSKMPIGVDARSLVNRIEQTGRTLQSILNDILDFSKIEANQMSLESSTFTLADVLDSVSNIMLGDPSRQDVDVAITPPPVRLRALLGDGFRLGQVLTNLVGNAIKFTHRGFVRLDVSEVASNDTSTTLRFAVRDSGIGMSEAVMADIFNPFSQADASTTRRYGGTGLGLSISRRLIEMMGGTLAATSVLGRGSEFAFTLSFPFATGTPEVNHLLKNLELLIADDSDISRDALRSTALSLGWNPTVVDGGIAALEIVSQRQKIGQAPLVLVLDWKMPDLDGLCVAKAVNEELQGDQGPIIILATAHSREELLADPDSRLADAVLNKPVSASAMYDAVAAAMVKRGTLASRALSKGGARLKAVRMLVVDDSEVNREVARLIFEGEEALVSTACDGQEALQWLHAHADQVDIVLMDVQMPHMNGIEATQRIRVDGRFNNLPIVALSAGAFAEDRVVAIAAGMNEHITKPMDVERAVALIVSMLQSGSVAPSGASQDSGAEPASSAAVRYAGLDVEGSVRVWRSEDKYRLFLRRFMVDYTAQLHDLESLSEAARLALAHKLAGAAGSLGLTDVNHSANQYEMVLRKGGDLNAAMADLKRHIGIAWESMRTYLGQADPPNESETAGGLSRSHLALLLERLLVILASDNPSGSEDIMVILDKSLKPVQANALHDAIAKFDFRQAEEVVKAIAAQYQISLKESP